MNQLIESIEADQLKTDTPDFKIGDTISVHYRIIEGEKERIQVFTGIVIARKGGGISETVSIYRVAYGSAMERVLLIHSPRIAKIEVVKRGKVRKSKLYFLRGMFGKKAKIKEMIVKASKGSKKGPQSQVHTPPAEAAPSQGEKGDMSSEQPEDTRAVDHESSPEEGPKDKG